MEEKRVSVDGVTRTLDKPFFVIATQNPVGASGTQKLPDSQLDRFSVRLSLGYPDHNSATEILMGKSFENIDEVNEVLTTQQLLVMQESAEQIFVKEELYSYIVHLVEKTRGNEYLSLGISPRGSIAILKMAKAHAFMQDRSYLVPEDIHRVFQSVCNHRLQLSTKAKASGFTTEDILEEILKTVPIPRLS